MTLTIELTPEEEAALQAQAHAAGLEASEYVRQLLASDLVNERRPMTGAEMIAQWEHDGVIDSYGDPDVDAPELARRIREHHEKSGSEDLLALETHQGTVYIRGTGIKVRLLAEATRQGYTVPDFQEAHPQLTLAQIYAALAYYYAHQQNMDADIERRAAHVADLRTQSEQPTRQQLEERLREQGLVMTPDGLKKTA